MNIKIDPGALKKTKWHEYLIRFVFGGLITVAAGLVAKKWGPAVGGLFLAFPAIFPASVSLVQKHENQDHEKKGQDGAARGRRAAGVDAAGARLGSVALAVFALIVWLTITKWNLWASLITALLAWMTVSVIAWFARRETLHHLRRTGGRAKTAGSTTPGSPRATSRP